MKQSLSFFCLFTCLLAVASPAHAAPPTLQLAFEVGLGMDIEAQGPHPIQLLEIRRQYKEVHPAEIGELEEAEFLFSDGLTARAHDHDADLYRPMTRALEEALGEQQLLPAGGIVFTQSPLIERKVGQFLRQQKIWDQNGRWVDTFRNHVQRPLLRISRVMGLGHAGDDYLVEFMVEAEKHHWVMRGHDSVDIGEGRVEHTLRTGRHANMEEAFKLAFGMSFNGIEGALRREGAGPGHGRYQPSGMLKRQAQLFQLRAAEHLGDEAKFQEILVRFLGQYRNDIPTMIDQNVHR